MPETATRLPRARTTRNPAWLDALDVYKRSFDATSAETLIEGAEAFAEMSPDDQAFHQAHLTFRQVQGLGDIHAVLRRIDARLAGLGPEALAGMKDLPTMKKALVSIARGQNEMLRIVAQGGLSDAVNGDNDDDDDGEGLTISIKLFGEIGFYNLHSALVLVVHVAAMDVVTPQLAAEIAAGDAAGPRVRVGSSGGRVAEYAVRLKPGMRKAVPPGGFGEFGVEAGWRLTMRQTEQ